MTGARRCVLLLTGVLLPLQLERVRGFALSLPAESRKRITPVLDTFTETYERLNKEARDSSVPATQRFRNVLQFVREQSLPALQKVSQQAHDVSSGSSHGDSSLVIVAPTDICPLSPGYRQPKHDCRACAWVQVEEAHGSQVHPSYPSRRPAHCFEERHSSSSSPPVLYFPGFLSSFPRFPLLSPTTLSPFSFAMMNSVYIHMTHGSWAST